MFEDLGQKEIKLKIEEVSGYSEELDLVGSPKKAWRIKWYSLSELWRLFGKKKWVERGIVAISDKVRKYPRIYKVVEENKDSEYEYFIEDVMKKVKYSSISLSGHSFQKYCWWHDLDSLFINEKHVQLVVKHFLKKDSSRATTTDVTAQFVCPLVMEATLDGNSCEDCSISVQ